MYPLLVVVWAFNSLAFIYAIGLLLATYRRGASATYSLMKFTATLAAVTAGSVYLFSHGHPTAAAWLAVAPLLVTVGGYGLFMLVMIFAARSGKGRWN
jgi:hypothetical protein